MALADKTWKGISVHEVVLKWLSAERHKDDAKAFWPSLNLPPTVKGLPALLDSPNLDDGNGNLARQKLLCATRDLFISHIPFTTIWYRVEFLTDTELSELYAVNHPDWIDSRDQNELRKVAVRKPLSLNEDWSLWEPPILIGHSKNGPFSILEGNHRLIAYTGSGQTGLKIPVIVGLSEERCHWSIFDNVG